VSPGLGNDYGLEAGKKYYNYYQWVCFVLFFQALMCYFPKWLWETWERGLMKTIVCGLNTGLKSEDEKNSKKTLLIEYLIRYLNVSPKKYKRTNVSPKFFLKLIDD